MSVSEFLIHTQEQVLPLLSRKGSQVAGDGEDRGRDFTLYLFFFWYLLNYKPCECIIYSKNKENLNVKIKHFPNSTVKSVYNMLNVYTHAWTNTAV